MYIPDLSSTRPFKVNVIEFNVNYIVCYAKIRLLISLKRHFLYAFANLFCNTINDTLSYCNVCYFWGSYSISLQSSWEMFRYVTYDKNKLWKQRNVTFHKRIKIKQYILFYLSGAWNSYFWVTWCYPKYIDNPIFIS